MSALSTGYLCDGDDCGEFHSGHTFPSAIAAMTWRAAFYLGWRETGSPRSDERRTLCPACAVKLGYAQPRQMVT